MEQCSVFAFRTCKKLSVKDFRNEDFSIKFYKKLDKNGLISLIMWSFKSCEFLNFLWTFAYPWPFGRIQMTDNGSSRNMNGIFPLFFHKPGDGCYNLPGF